MKLQRQKNITNRDDATTRSFRVKNFLKILPTYKVLWERKIWVSIQINAQDVHQKEKHGNTQICSKNGANDTEYNIFVNSIDEVLSNIESDEVYNEEDIVSFKDRIMELAANASLITRTENLNPEIKRGIINKK